MLARRGGELVDWIRHLRLTAAKAGVTVLTVDRCDGFDRKSGVTVLIVNPVAVRGRWLAPSRARSPRTTTFCFLDVSSQIEARPLHKLVIFQANRQNHFRISCLVSM